MSLLIYVIQQSFRFLIFRPLKVKSQGQLNALVIAGIVYAWIAGLGRYWDHPSAEPWQYAGLGSVGYIFILSALIWLIVWPLRPPHWQYRTVLAFVGLTSPLAWLYAIPVERFTSMDTAISLNIWFLVIVAAWRVALFVQFLRKVAKLQPGKILIISLLPLTLIMATLAILNLEHAVFEIMAGLEQERRGQEVIHDSVYAVILFLGAFSMPATVALILLYLAQYIEHRVEQKWLKENRGPNNRP